MNTNEQREPCECEAPGLFRSGVPGILAVVDECGKILSAVERCDTCERYATDDEARAVLLSTLARERVRALAARYVPANEREQETAAAIVAAQVPDVRRADAESWALALFRERDEAQARTLRRAGFLRGTE